RTYQGTPNATLSERYPDRVESKSGRKRGPARGDMRNIEGGDMRRNEALPRRAGNVGSERLRILRDLHDGLGPILTGMAFGLRGARNLLRRDPESAARLLAQLEEEVLGAIAEVRRLTDEIRPCPLDRVDLVEAIRLHAMTLSSRVAGADG